MVKKKAVKEMKKAVEQGKQQTLVEIASTKIKRTKIQEHTAMELAGKELTDQIRDFFPAYCKTFPKYDFSKLPTDQDMARLMDGYPVSEVLPRERMEKVSKDFDSEMGGKVPEDISRDELMEVYVQHLRPSELRERYQKESLA